MINLKYRNDKNALAVAAYWKRPLDKYDCYKVNNISDDETELYVYDVLGWPFNDINMMVKEVSAIKTHSILVRLNSPGGDIIDTFNLYQTLKNHSSRVIVRIEALAASAASVLAMAGDEVQAYSTSLMMIHNSWVWAAGNRNELRSTADLLEKIDTNIRDTYTERTKIGKKEMTAMMDDETWFNAKEMKEKGFIDTIIGGKAAKAEFDLSIFSNLPKVDDDQTIFTGFDVEKALRDAKAPKGFAKAVAAACRAANLVDRCHADDKIDGDNPAVATEAANQAGINELKAEIEKLTSRLKQY